MNRFFVYHPVFAWVIALFIALAGAIGLINLPVEQYPSVAPPSLNLSFQYPGADADTMDRNVTSVIEKELNGVEKLLYMSSTSRANGSAQVTVTFESGTDMDVARTQVQDRIGRVETRLPEEVRRLGVQVREAASGFLAMVALTSKSGSTPILEIGNYANNNIIDELRRIEGVGDVQLFASPYAMRIWLDPEKLAGYNLSPSEALAAVQEQNGQTAGGGLGDQPIAKGTEFNARIVTQNRFSSPEQFRQIIVRSNPDGSTVRLGDVARVELGADSYNFSSRLNGKPAAMMAIQMTSGANAVATVDAVNARMAELAETFPPDMAWSVPFDSTPFINASIDSVVQTLVEAMILVFLVMFLFLQNWRATLIPTIVVPIALLGACLGLWLFGYSINTLSLFAMVVAIGILVDDAIVVVENVERIMAEEGLSPRRATVKAMGQITNAIIGITLVLAAVFVPMAFFPGSTGGIYRQFSVTLAISILFSALLALTLTPALCGALLKPGQAHGADGHHNVVPRAGIRGWPQRFFNWFNDRFGRATDRYTGSVGKMLGRPLRWLAVFVAMVGITALLFTRVPGGFLPNEDQGYVMINVDAPPAATSQRTDVAMRKVERFALDQPQTELTVAVLGFNFFGQGQSAGMVIQRLKPWDERPGFANSAAAMAGKIMGFTQGIPEANVFAITPPPIPALGNATGFSMKLQNRAGDREALTQARDAILARAMQSKLLAGVRPEGQPNTPQLYVDIDRVQARALGLSIANVNATLSISFGSAYANDFVREGSVLRVYLQAAAEQRMTPEDVLALRVRNDQGQMVPFSAFTRVRWTDGPQQLERYNGYASMTISGQAAPGQSSGAALAEMERIAAEVLKGDNAFEWTGVAREEKEAGGQVGLLLALSLLVVFLLLAALYESWAIPLAVLLVVPFGVLGAVAFTFARGLSADVYFNVGLITIIGLAAKNAILIVEFAIEQKKAGVVEATMEAARQRLRPILMTSLAFILGMVPLVIASGAGAASRQAVGTGVMGGMIAATIFGIFFTPVFYLAARRWLARDNNHEADDAREEADEAARGAETPHA
ncbi:MAG TPA: multidrug efflux RND transporter permease subunit [Sphingomonas sp.]|nr:multidrug efflux RND transporter permease subunit [Sphingomonas sp.]